MTVSVVVPVFNEQEVLPEFHSRLKRVLDTVGMPVEIVFVNDGSRDASLQMLRELASRDPAVRVVDLSRNFGKEIALTAGLDHASGDAVVVIDADLQDPPELIPDLIRKWREGFDVVYATRRVRHGEGWMKRTTASLFYRMMSAVGEVSLPRNTGDFRLLSRRCIAALRSCRERHRFMKGLFVWIGFAQTSILYDRDPRFAGETKWNYWRLWNLAVEGLTSFTIAPLRLATLLGLLVAASAFVYGGIIVVRTILAGGDVPGYPSLMVVILFLGGIQLMALGVIGEYVGRVFDETKGRPLYLVSSIDGTGQAMSALTPIRTGTLPHEG